MIDVSNEVKALYHKDNTPAFVYLTIGNTEYGPRNILSGSVTLTESICSGEVFDLSSVEKNSLEFTLINVEQDISELQGQTVVAVHRLTLGDNSTYDLPLGTFTIVNAQNDGDYLIKCTCYDGMMAFDNIIDDWWNALEFPTTVGDILTGLCTHCNVPYNFTGAYNMDFVVTARPTYFEGVKGSELLGYIQEILCGFVKINRTGTAELIGKYDSALYPSEVLYPKEGMYPAEIYTYWHQAYGDKEEFDYRSIVTNMTIADYQVAPISKVIIRSNEKDVGVSYGEGANAYIIESNPLLYNITTATGEAIAESIYTNIHNLVYTPFDCKVVALPYLLPGDWVQLVSFQGKEAISPLFKRTLNGPSLSFDNMSCKGKQLREETRSTTKQTKILNQKIHEVINTVDTFSSTITEIEGDVAQHTTQIAQNSNEITLMAQKIGYQNYLTNSNFTDIDTKIKYWDLTSSYYEDAGTWEYVDDRDFVLSDGKAMKITKTSTTKTYARIQEIDVSDIELNGKTIYFLFLLKVLSSSRPNNYALCTVTGVNDDGTTESVISTWINPSAGIGTYSRFRFRKVFTTDKTYKKLRVYLPHVPNPDVISYEINNLCLLILDSTAELPPFGTWTNIAQNNLISQINVAPEGIKIQGEKIDIYGLTTFHNADGTGGTTIDGSTLTAPNINAGTITGTVIQAATIRGVNSSINFEIIDNDTTYALAFVPTDFGGNGYYPNTYGLKLSGDSNSTFAIDVTNIEFQSDAFIIHKDDSQGSPTGMAYILNNNLFRFDYWNSPSSSVTLLRGDSGGISRIGFKSNLFITLDGSGYSNWQWFSVTGDDGYTYMVLGHRY